MGFDVERLYNLKKQQEERGRTGIVFQYKYFEALCLLDDEERSEFLLALYEYDLTGELPQMTKRVGALVRTLKYDIDKTRESWERNKKNASKTAKTASGNERSELAEADSNGEPITISGGGAFNNADNIAALNNADKAVKRAANRELPKADRVEKGNGGAVNPNRKGAEAGSKPRGNPVSAIQSEYGACAKTANLRTEAAAGSPALLSDANPNASPKSRAAPLNNAAPFVPPGLDQVERFIRENNLRVSARDFINYYESNGWMVGVNKMNNWRASLKRWENIEFSNKQPAPEKTGKPGFAQREFDEEAEKKRRITAMLEEGARIARMNNS